MHLLTAVTVLSPDTKFFFTLQDTTTFDEIQSYADFPKDGKPIVAVLGKFLGVTVYSLTL